MRAAARTCPINARCLGALNAVAIEHSISIYTARACFDGSTDAVGKARLAVLEVEELIFIAEIVGLLVC